MDAQTLSNKTDAFRSNFFIKLGNNKKLLIISSVLSMLGMPLVIAARIIDFREDALRKAMVDYMYSYVPYTAPYYYVIGIISLCILLAVVLVAAFNTYQYMYNKPMVDVIFSLPITVNQRFFSDYLSGLAVFGIPFIASAIPSFIINALGFSLCSQWKEYQGDSSSAMIIFKAYVIMLLIAVMLYSSAVLILSICGSLFESILYTIVFNVILPITMAALFSMAERCVYGLSTSQYMSDALMYTTFVGGIAYIVVLFSDVVENDVISSSLPDVTLPAVKWFFIYLLVILIISAAAYFLYKSRKAEDVSKPFAFKWAYYIFITCVCFRMMCGMFIATDYGNVSSALPWLIMTMIIFLLLDTIQNRGFKKFLAGILKFAAITGGSCLLLFIYSATDGLGAAYYVPSANSVKSVEITRRGAILSRYNSDADVFLDSEEEAELITGIHSSVVERYRESKNKDERIYTQTGRYPSNHLEITYTLKSGRKVSRNYYSVSDEECRMLRKYELNEVNIENIIRNMKIDTARAHETDSYRAYIMNKVKNYYFNEKNVDYEKLTECYEKDLRNTDIDYITATPKVMGYFDNYAIFDTFTETLSYLESAGIKFTNESLMSSVTANTDYYSGERISICFDTSYFADEDGYVTSEFVQLANYENGKKVDVKTYTTNAKTMESLLNILLKAEPIFSTTDTDSLLILYNNCTYIVPAECQSDIYNIVNYGNRIEEQYSYGGYTYYDGDISLIE